MGDKSRKSKQRSDNQKKLAKEKRETTAKAKQDRQGRAQKPVETAAPGKG